MLAGKAGDLGRTGEDDRGFVKAVSWVVRTGSPSRDLHKGFGGWNSGKFREFSVILSVHDNKRHDSVERYARADSATDVESSRMSD